MLQDAKNIKQLSEGSSQAQSKRNFSDSDMEESVVIQRLKSELQAKNKEIQKLKNKIESGPQFSELKLALVQIQDFLAMAPFSIYFKNRDLEYTYANQAFSAWANIQAEDLIGLNNKQLQIGNYLSELEKIELKVIEKGKPIQNKEILFSLDSEQLLMSAYVFPMMDEMGSIEGLMVCCLDLSEKAQFKKELLEAERKALLGVKSKQAFMSNLSHEIRTPLHGILGSSALLKSMLTDNQAFDLLSNVINSGNTLLEMVDSLFLLESLEKGEWKIQKAPFKLREVVQEVNDKFYELAKVKMVDLQSFVAQGLPDILVGDIEKIKLIITVFLSNAVKFTDKGFVHLFVQAEQQKGNRIQLKFSVKDTGTGIKKDLQPDLFSSFTQGDSSSTKGYQGTGIGLAMAEKTISY